MEYLINRGVRRIVITSISACPQKVSGHWSSKSKQVLIKHYKADVSNFQHMEQIMKNVNVLQSIFPLLKITTSAYNA